MTKVGHQGFTFYFDLNDLVCIDTAMEWLWV